MQRTISNLISILIVLIIVIGIVISVGTIIPRFIQAQSPKKGILAISGSDAIYDLDTNILWIIVRGVYQGAESVQIVDIEIIVPGTTETIPVEVVSGGNLTLKPNSYFKIIARASTTQIPEKILVSINYCFRDNTCLSSVEFVKVEKKS